MSINKENLIALLQNSARGSLFLILGQILSTIISAIGTLLIARMLGANDYGLIAIAQIPVLIANLLINSGLTRPLTRYLSLYRHEEKNDVLKTYIIAGILIHIILGFSLFLLVYLYSGYFANTIFNISELDTLIKIFSISILANSLLNGSFAIFEGYERMGLRSSVTIFYSILKSILGPILVYVGYGSIGAITGNSLSHLLVGIIGILLVYIIYKNETGPSQSFTIFNASKSIILYGYPLYISSILSGGITQFFKFLLPLYVSPELIGNLAAATNFSVLLTFFSLPISTSIFPLFSKLKINEELEFIFRNVIRYLSLIIFPIVSTLIALSDQVIPILYTKTYSYSSLYLKIRMINFFFIGLNTTSNLLNSQNKTDITLKGNLIYTIMGLPLGLFLIPRYGIEGFLFADIFSSKIGLLYMVLWVRKNFGITIPWKNTLKILFSSIISYTSCYIFISLFQFNPVIEIVFGGVISTITYIISIIFTKSIYLYDVNNLKSLSRAFGPFESIYLLIIDFMSRFIK